jgi:predicted Zn-dependent protease
MRKRFFILAVLLFSLFFLYKCAVNPVTGKKELMFIPESTEINIGKKVDLGVKSQYGLYDDKQLNQYVSTVGQSIVPFTHRPKLKYHFSVLDSSVVNAFAAPGGYIYITRGLLALLNSEAELATVLGHELGHVNARHSAKAMTRTILLNLGLVIGSALSEDIKKYAPFVSIASQVLFLKYSRDNEYQADSLGVRYARRAGYNSGVMIKFFKSLRKLEAKGGHTLPNFLSTHPLTVKRIDRVKTLLKPEDNKLAIKQKDYLYKLDNLVYGSDPRQGYTQGGVFYHPIFRFKFNIPTGWKIANTPKQVTLSTKNGDAVILFSGEYTDNRIKDYAEKLYMRFENAVVSYKGYTKVNGFNGYYMNFNIYNNQNASGQASETKVYLISIRKGNYIFSFLAAAKPLDFRFYKKQFANVIFSFSQLNNPYYINRKPLRIHIVRIIYLQTMKELLISRKISQKYWKKILYANNKTLSSKLRKGQLIKLIY